MERSLMLESEGTAFLEISGATNLVTKHQTPEVLNPQLHHCENLKFHSCGLHCPPCENCFKQYSFDEWIEYQTVFSFIFNLFFILIIWRWRSWEKTGWTWRTFFLHNTSSSVLQGWYCTSVYFKSKVCLHWGFSE